MEKKRSSQNSPGILLPKSPLVYEKYKSGCGWGLISLFGFRQGRSSKREISNKAHKNSVGNGYSESQLDLLQRFHKKCQRIDDVVDEEKTQKFSVAKTRNLQSDSKPVGESSKGERRTRKPRDRHISDRGEVFSLGHKQPSQPHFMERSRNKSKASRGRGCKCIDTTEHEQRHEIKLQFPVNEAAEALINRRLKNGEGSGNDRSKHFLDALDILSSNKELFVKLLQNPDSLSAKHIQDGSELLETRMKKPRDQLDRHTNPQESDCIVLLKPGLTSQRYRNMKKKLQHVIRVGKDEFQSSPETGAKAESFGSFRSSNDNRKGNRIEVALTNSYNTLYVDSRGIAKSSPATESRKKTDDEVNYKSGSRQYIETLMEGNDLKPDDQSQISDPVPSASKNSVLNPREQEDIYFLGDDSSRGYEVMETNHSATCGEEIHILGDNAANGSWGNGYLEFSSQDSSSGKCSPVFQADLSPTRAEETETAKLQNDQQSPVSVLLDFHMEDLPSPDIPTSRTAKECVQPRRIDFNEHNSSPVSKTPTDFKINLTNAVEVTEYARRVLEASGLNWTDLLTKRALSSSDQLFEQSLLDESLVETRLDQSSIDDNKLLFDYINEILGACRRYMKLSSPVSLKNHRLLDFAMTNDVVYAAMKRLDWRLLADELPPRTMDQLIEKDLAKPWLWMDLCVETEDIVADMVESIFEELEMEIVTLIFT